MEIYQHHEVSEVEIGETEVDMLLEAKGRQHIEAIIESIAASGYRLK
jgi:hypothetical protein